MWSPRVAVALSLLGPVEGACANGYDCVATRCTEEEESCAATLKKGKGRSKTQVQVQLEAFEQRRIPSHQDSMVFIQSLMVEEVGRREPAQESRPTAHPQWDALSGPLGVSLVSVVEKDRSAPDRRGDVVVPEGPFPSSSFMCSLLARVLLSQVSRGRPAS